MHEMPAVKEAKEAKEEAAAVPAAAAVATKGSAAVSGSGQASVATQTIGDQTQSVGAVTVSGADDAVVRQPEIPVGASVSFGSQSAVNANVPINIQIKDLKIDPAIASGGSQAATNGGTNTVTSTTPIFG